MDAVNYGKLRVVMLIASVALGCEKAETLSGIEPVYNPTTGQILNIQGDEASVNGLNDLACVPMIGVNASVAASDPEITGGSICFHSHAGAVE